MVADVVITNAPISFILTRQHRALSSAALLRDSPTLSLQTPGKDWHHFPCLSLSQISHSRNTPSAQFNAHFSTQILPSFSFVLFWSQRLLSHNIAERARKVLLTVLHQV